MAGEQSQGKVSPGNLFVTALPIGHQHDISLRALQVLRHVDIIAAKDPRTLQAFLRGHRISAVVTTYSRENAPEKVPVLLERLRRGYSIALVSDRGTPTVYDPGWRLVAQARRAGIPVVSVPGPSALTAAIAIAGLPADTLYFRGRFPARTAAMNRMVAALRQESCTSVFFVSATQLYRILFELSATLGTRRAVVAVDLTKTTERIMSGTIRSLLATQSPIPDAADVTLVLAGRSGKERRH